MVEDIQTKTGSERMFCCGSTGMFPAHEHIDACGMAADEITVNGHAESVSFLCVFDETLLNHERSFMADWVHDILGRYPDTFQVILGCDKGGPIVVVITTHGTSDVELHRSFFLVLLGHLFSFRLSLGQSNVEV